MNHVMRRYDEAANRRAFRAMVGRFCLIGLIVAAMFIVPLIGSLQ